MAGEWVPVGGTEAPSAHILSAACRLYRRTAGARRLHTGLTKSLYEKALQATGMPMAAAATEAWDEVVGSRGAAAMLFQDFLEALLAMARKGGAVGEHDAAARVAAWLS